VNRVSCGEVSHDTLTRYAAAGIWTLDNFLKQSEIILLVTISSIDKNISPPV